MAGLVPLRLVVAAAAFLAVLLPREALAGDEALCAAAGAEAERRQLLPPGLLLAIGQVESGRRDPASGRLLPWPWTTDAAGASAVFHDLPSALAATGELLAKGVASIDVGCFQINLAAHPKAFDTLEQAFDPAANADYASRLLVSLRSRLGDWDSAIAAYHSATPERGAAYRGLVLAAWGQTPQPDTIHGPAPAPVLRAISWFPASGGIRVWTPSGSAAPNVIMLPGAPSLPKVIAHVG